MYFNEKEDTNIDKQLKPKKTFEEKKKFFVIGGIILGAILLIIIIILIIRGINRYTLVLNGSSDITIYQGTVYNELGYEAYDRKRHNLNSEVTVQSNVDSNTIGTYTITYTFRNKVKKRTVNVVAKPAIVTIIHLNGSKNLYLNVGSQYNEPGYNAVDVNDGDLTSKVTTNSNLDTSKPGTYRIIYSVVNSSGVTTTETRTIIVQ